jgi:geranylgeranyl pyrophosphate synthase
VQDDILGIWGDEARTGKSAATDIHHQKEDAAGAVRPEPK